jgi:hypothetical protein
MAMTPAFWFLRAPSREQPVEEAPDSKHEIIICPADEGHRRGGSVVGGLSVILDPSGVRDFVWTWGNDILVSQRVLDLFKEYRVTGFQPMPAKTSYPKPITARPPKLFEFIVTGWGGWAAPAAGVSLVESCPACGDKIYTIAEPSRLIDPAAWDGSDLFLVWPLPGYRFVSDRLAAILRQEKASGVELVPAPKLPTERGARVAPATLTACMPKDRAHELSQRFGIS